MNPIRLLLANDQKIDRAGLHSLLGKQLQLEIVGEWITTKEAAELTGYDDAHIRRLVGDRRLRAQ